MNNTNNPNSSFYKWKLALSNLFERYKKYKPKTPFLVLIIFLFCLYSIILVYVSIRIYHKFFVNHHHAITEIIQWNTGMNFFHGLGHEPETTIELLIKKPNLQKLYKNRVTAMQQGILSPENRDKVNAIVVSNGDSIKVKIRLKGDSGDHWQDSTKLSFRIKILDEGKLFLGMSKFSIQHPITRNYVYEWLLHKFVKNEGIIGLEYDFIKVVINGNDHGIYAIEEHFTKELLERNSRNDGFFVRFSDEFYWQNESYSFYESDIKIYNEKKIKKEIVRNGVSKLEQFRRGILTASEVFDINKLAKWHSISAVLGAQHSLLWFNSVFYFNPNSNLFEPVCYDGNAGKAEDNLALNNYKYKHDPYLNILFSDLTYMEKYVNYLEFYSDKIYFENFLKTVSNELEIKIKEIHSDHLYFTYDSEVFNNNINMIKKQLKPLKALNSYYIKENDNTKILLGSLISLPTLLDKLLFQNNSIYDFENEVLKGKKDHNKIEYKAFDLPLGTIKLSKKENLFLTFQILGCSKLCTTKVVKYNSDYSVLFN